jgi:hypothetical protein
MVVGSAPLLRTQFWGLPKLLQWWLQLVATGGKRGEVVYDTPIIQVPPTHAQPELSTHMMGMMAICPMANSLAAIILTDGMGLFPGF